MGSSTSADRPRKAQDFAFAGDWSGYFGAVQGKGPRETLLTALSAFERDAKAAQGEQGEPRLAVDLACGEGRDTLELLRRGWRVLAIEPMSQGLALLDSQVPGEHRPRLSVQQADFARARWEPGVDLINCSFSLPFCPEDHFETLWARVRDTIRQGGRFAGQLFGDRDSWGRCGRTLMHSRTRINELFDRFTLEEMREEEKDDLGGQTPKHWHVFHIVARKR